VRLVELRLNAGYSQRGLTRAIGITPEVVKYAESGGRPRPANMKLIADFFGNQVTQIWPPQ